MVNCFCDFHEISIDSGEFYLCQVGGWLSDRRSFRLSGQLTASVLGRYATSCDMTEESQDLLNFLQFSQWKPLFFVGAFQHLSESSGNHYFYMGLFYKRLEWFQGFCALLKWLECGPWELFWETFSNNLCIYSTWIFLSGCQMDDKGCRVTPSLRVQTAPFGRCW